MKRFLLFLFSLILLFSLSSCVKLPVTIDMPSETLPPSEVAFTPPIGDAGMEYSGDAVLYLPSHDGMSLTSVTQPVSFSPARTAAESILRVLFSQKAGPLSKTIGGDIKLSLYGKEPVRVSRDTAIVNISPAALQLSREELYFACKAITNTLTASGDIRYVNILVAGKAVGLDMGNTLPMGAFSFSDATDLAAVYDQLLSRKTDDVQSEGELPFSANVSLFFPLTGSAGMACETRTLIFENQRTSDMVTMILQELSEGPQSDIQSPVLPLLASLLTSTPVIAEDAEAGGDVLILDFAHNLDDMLEAYSITREQSMNSLSATLCTFLPNIVGIRVGIKGYPTDTQFLIEEEDESSVSRVLTLSSSLEDLVYDYCTLWFPNAENGKLCKVYRPIPCEGTRNPRVLLSELLKGPLPIDSRTNTLPIIQNSVISESILLGFSKEGSTLLVNLKNGFVEAIPSSSLTDEQNFAYAIVNTLCMNPLITSVCFFQNGSQFDGNSQVYWRGVFYPYYHP